MVIAAVALLAVGIANIDVHPTETRTVTRTVVKRPPPKVVTKIKTVYSERPVGSGVMTRADCESLSKTEMDFRAIVARWGWPAGQNGEDSGSDTLYYKLTDAPDEGECQIGFWNGKVDDVDIEEDWL
jgi:hypothetical protein